MSLRELDPTLGEITRQGEAVTLVFHRRFARPIEKVWAALTVPERISDWFAEAKVDHLEAGGTIQLHFTGADYRSLARIEVVDPPRPAPPRPAPPHRLDLVGDGREQGVARALRPGARR